MNKALDLLLIDDDDFDRLSVLRTFRRSSEDINVTEAADAQSAVDLLHEKTFDCILLDFRLADSNGLDVLAKIESGNLTDAPVIMLTGMDNEAIISECLNAGAQDYLLKSEISSNSLIRSIRYARERKIAAEKVRYLALHDSLTGLANRDLLRSNLENAISRADRNKTYFAIFILDLDNFKAINDTLGHQGGDELLKLVSRRLVDEVRKHDLVARMSGDEFAMLIEDMHSREDCVKIAQSILRAFQPSINLNGQKAYVTPSIGIADYPDCASNIDELLQCADTAMYRAKRDGRNNYRFYSHELQTLASEHAELKNDLHAALEKEQFELYYQPIFSAEKRNIVGMEALLRWRHPTRGYIPPSEFIPVAEKSALIRPLGQWVLKTACDTHSQWNARRLFGENPLRLAVNISAKQIQQQEGLTSLCKIIHESGMHSKLLTLELTEESLIEDIDQCGQRLAAMSSEGASIAIDDFGTGYASFRHLKKLPLQVLKIDRSFVENLCEDKSNAAIVTAMVSMAKALAMDVVAEGVETIEQAETLTACGCDYLQGFYCSKPLSEANMERLLIEQGALHSLTADNPGACYPLAEY